ncbi:MAG: zinc ABC transporter substrate-binding protein [Kiritimatiellia bacterium]
MKRNSIAFLLVVLAGLGFSACAGRQADGPSAVVTTTLIETAVRDLVGPDVPIIRLMPSGSCPGHFDLDPGQVKHLASAALFIRHDFQAGLDAGVVKSGLATNRIVAVPSRSAFTIPSNYVALCEGLAVCVSQTWPDKAAHIDSALIGIKRKAADVEKELAGCVQRLHGRKVLCARYQRDFCQWLGLNVVSTFQAGTDESAWQVSRAVDMARTKGSEAVIGNRQWGPRHLEALAEASGLPGIMLSNFPDTGEAGANWRLLDANVNALLKGFP